MWRAFSFILRRKAEALARDFCALKTPLVLMCSKQICPPESSTPRKGFEPLVNAIIPKRGFP